MGSKTWKKIEKSKLFRSTKLRLKQLIGKEPKFKIDIDLKTEHRHGWDIVPSLIDRNDTLYSLGICDDIGFELDVISRYNLQVFAFDPTPYSVEWIGNQSLPSEFKFYPWAVSGTDGHFFLYPRIKKRGTISKIMYTFHKEKESRSDGIMVRALSLESIMQQLSHARIDILKMDIEGAEYDVISNFLSLKLRPKMILIEFHHRFKSIGKQKTIDAVNSLRINDYLIASISETGRELCFIYKAALK